jgi:hypothetical protein
MRSRGLSSSIFAQASNALLLESGSADEKPDNPVSVFDSRDNPFLSRRGRESFFSLHRGRILGGDTQIYGFSLEAAQIFTFGRIRSSSSKVRRDVDTWGGNGIIQIYDKLLSRGSNDFAVSIFTMSAQGT